MKRSRTHLLASMVVSLLSLAFSATSHAAMDGTVTCSGALTVASTNFINVSCDGNLSFSDARVTDPFKVMLMATGQLDLINTTIESGTIDLYAAVVRIDTGSRLDSSTISISTTSSAPMRHPDVVVSVPSAPGNTGSDLPVASASGGATLSWGSGWPHAGDASPPSNGGQLTLNGGAHGTPSISGNASSPPLIGVVGTVPEPAIGLLFIAGLGAIGLARRLPVRFR